MYIGGRRSVGNARSWRGDRSDGGYDEEIGM